jgi:hypothetical protein
MSFGRDMMDSIVAGFIVLVVIAFLLGGAAVWGLPKLWHWLKPIIHGVTQ